MRKVFLVMALFFAIAANAANDMGVVKNTLQDVTIEKKDVLGDINFEEVSVMANENLISEADLLFGCGSQGNSFYDQLRANGLSHREARAERRAFVRECRGFPDTGWLLFPWPFNAFN